MIAQDSFGRTVSNGFGTSEVGGPWTLSGTSSQFSVNGGVGRISLPTPGLTRAAYLNQVSGRDVDARIDMSLGATPVGGGGQYCLILRRIGESNYGLRVRALPTSTSIQLYRAVNGAATVIATQTIAGYVAAPGDVMHVRFQAVGTGTTALRAMFWVNNQPVPATWTIQANDTTAALQAPGAVGVLAYVSSSSSGAVLFTVDNFAVTPG